MEEDYCIPLLEDDFDFVVGQIVDVKFDEAIAERARHDLTPTVQTRRVLRGEEHKVRMRAHQTTAMRLQTIPDDQQWLLQVGLERLEEFDDLFLLDAAVAEPEQAVRARECCDDRDVIPAEMTLNVRRLPLGGPSAHTGRALVDAGLVYEDDPSAFSLGIFGLGQVRLQKRTASSLRSINRFSGFCGQKSLPSGSQRVGLQRPKFPLFLPWNTSTTNFAGNYNT